MLWKEKNLNEKNLENAILVRLTISYLIKLIKLFIIILIFFYEQRIILAMIESIIIYTIITIITVKSKLDII